MAAAATSSDALARTAAAEMLFEPTGDLAKDYSAYCETEDRPERDDLVDAIHMQEQKDADGIGRMRTVVVARNLDYCLNKRDLVPLANAIPHCPSLSSVQLTGCGVTEHSLKVLVEAVYKSPSMSTVAIDFNPGGLFKDPTVTKKDRNEVFVLPAQFRSAHLQRSNDDPHAPSSKDEKKGGGGAAGKGDAAKKGGAAAPVAAVAPRIDDTPIAIPTGFHALLMTGIQVLSLRGNAIGDKQAEQIAGILEANADLLSLSLWGNTLTSVGATAIAKALRTNRRLTALNLGSNRIDDAGLAALANIFVCADASNDEAAKMRLRTLHLPASSAGSPAAELPVLPTWTDVVSLLAAPFEPKVGDDKKAGGKKDAAPPAKAKAKGAEVGPVERPKGDFDRDCFRLDEGRVRIPGNTCLWGLNLTSNPGISAAGVRGVIAILRSREPVPTPDAAAALVSAGMVLPPPSTYACSLAIERLEIDCGDDLSLRQELDAAMAELTAHRATSSLSGE